MKMLSLLAATLAAVSAATADKCYAIAFSSGDEDAVYQAGVVKGITSSTKLQPSEYQYSAVSGVSTGALNAAILAKSAPGQEAAGAQAMESFWGAASQTKLYQNWWIGILGGLFKHSGLYDSSPLLSFLKKEFKDVKMQRKIDIGIVDIVTGKYKDFQNDNIEVGENLVDALYASVSFAGFFAPAGVFGSQYYDGSAVWDVDIFTAINECTKLGFAQSDIVVDVALTSSASIRQVHADYYTSVPMLFRYLEVKSFFGTMDALLRAKFAYKDVNFRYVVSPSQKINSSLKPLSLNQKQVDAAIALGVKDAQAVINKGAAQSFDALTHYFALKTRGDERMNQHSLGTFLAAKDAGEFEEYDIMEDDFMRKYTHRANKKQEL